MCGVTHATHQEGNYLFDHFTSYDTSQYENAWLQYWFQSLPPQGQHLLDTLNLLKSPLAQRPPVPQSHGAAKAKEYTWYYYLDQLTGTGSKRTRVYSLSPSSSYAAAEQAARPR